MTADVPDSPPSGKAPTSRSLLSPASWPGIAISLVIALVSTTLAAVPAAAALGLSALTIAIVIGLLLANTWLRRPAPRFQLGLDLAKGPLLRWGIVLYGFRLTFTDVASVGIHAALLDALVVCTTFVLALWLGRRIFGLRNTQVALIGAGAAICGAAAVLATAPVVRGKQDDVTVAVATVIGFGTLSIFLYPALYPLLAAVAPVAFDAAGFGLYAGATIHEVAQVVAVGDSLSDDVASAAVVTKMVRVMLLAPFLLLLSALWKHSAAELAAAPAPRRRNSVPWFALGFIAVVGFNSLDALPAGLRDGLIVFDNLLLATAMAALGLQTRLSTLRAAGSRPMLLAALLYAWLLIGGALMHGLLDSLLRGVGIV